MSNVCPPPGAATMLAYGCRKGRHLVHPHVHACAYACAEEAPRRMQVPLSAPGSARGWRRCPPGGPSRTGPLRKRRMEREQRDVLDKMLAHDRKAQAQQVSHGGAVHAEKCTHLHTVAHAGTQMHTVQAHSCARKKPAEAPGAAVRLLRGWLPDL